MLLLGRCRRRRARAVERHLERVGLGVALLVRRAVLAQAVDAAGDLGHAVPGEERAGLVDRVVQDVGVEPEVAVGREDDGLSKRGGLKTDSQHQRPTAGRGGGGRRTRAEMRVAACAASWSSCDRRASMWALTSALGGARPAMISLCSKMSKSTIARWIVSHTLEGLGK